MASGVKKGYMGYKIWHGTYNRALKKSEEGIKYFDNLAHELVLVAMEKSGMPGHQYTLQILTALLGTGRNGL